MGAAYQDAARDKSGISNYNYRKAAGLSGHNCIERARRYQRVVITEREVSVAEHEDTNLPRRS